MSQEIIRPRSKYKNKQSYDDELAIVLFLLSGAKHIEKDILKDFEKIFRELSKLYKEQFPFYYKNGVLNKDEYLKLLLSFQTKDFDSAFENLISQMSKDVKQLESNKLMAWLILDYELTAKKTAQSIGDKSFTNTIGLLTDIGKKEAVLEPWCKDNKNFLERIDIAITDMEDKLHGVIAEGLYKGWSIETMVKKFQTITGIAAYKARRLIRTETMAVYSKATKNTFLANGIEYVEIIGDALCGTICVEYVGEAMPLREAQIGLDLPPYHPNCACSFCSYEEFGEEIEEE